MASLETAINETKFCLTINQISQLVTLRSQKLTLQNVSWQLMIFKSQKENSLVLSLTCFGASDIVNWSCAATASMELRSFSPNKEAKMETILPYVFHADANHTSRTLIGWTELFNATSVYVQNDRIKIDVKIMAKDLINNNKTNSQVINRTHDSVKMHLTIHEASSLLAALSTPFDFCNLT